MTKLTRLATSSVVTLAFGFSTLAQATCPPPNPGEMSSPPCSATQFTSDDSIQGQTQTTTTTTTTDTTTPVTEVIVTDTAIDLIVGTILSLF